MQRIGNNIIYAAIIALACFLPEVGFLVDGDILPKWYLLGLSLCAFVITYGISGLNDAITLPSIKVTLTAVASLVSLWAVIESAFNGWIAAHGPFDNPAGLAISLCCVLALNSNVIGTNGRTCKWLNITSITIMACAVIASQSRCGIVALMLIVASSSFQHKRRLIGYVLLVLLSCATIGLSAMKSSSTSGRAFILYQTWSMVAEHPLKGWGVGGFEHCYMLQQASYFEMNPDSPAAILADDIRHPLCEYLLWWVNYGIAGILAIILLLFYPVFKARDKSVRIACLLICWFATVSYPLHYPIVWLILIIGWGQALPQNIINHAADIVPMRMIRLICLMAVLVILGHATISYLLMQADKASVGHKHAKALRIYRHLETICQYNPYYLYSYSRECYTIGLFEEALHWNDRCHRYWSSYDLTLLRGDILYHFDRLYDAEHAYILASHMCPVRFAPLAGLMDVYETAGDRARLIETAVEIRNRPIKVPSGNVENIKRKAAAVLENYSK